MTLLMPANDYDLLHGYRRKRRAFPLKLHEYKFVLQLKPAGNIFTLL